MSDIIQLLPDSVANQIAAGEVIQRPASVVKELVENALDAGADEITIHIKDAGKTMIQVTDNGCGMSPTDARMAFERHATSKISAANDLFSIRTLGFRGEAMASIAAIADVELRTKRLEEEVGTLIHVTGTEVKKQEPVGCSNGTSITVKNLFFNVPARRKFLKANTTELKHIINEIHRVALPNPEIRFSVFHNNAQLYELPKSNFRRRIVDIFGKTLNHSLIPIGEKTSLTTISGFVGQPKFARKTMGEQFFFVNRRYMRHPYFHKAVMLSYEKLLPSDAFPSYFLFLEIDPASIDINVHPTKTEIKFEDERSIWQLIFAIVRESLGKHNVVPSIDFDQDGSIEIPIAKRDKTDIPYPGISINPGYNPFEQEKTPSSRIPKSAQTDQKHFSRWEELYKGTQLLLKPENQDVASQDSGWSPKTLEGSSFKKVLQLKQKYILSPVKSGLMLIDQRRAHERILFEQFMEVLKSESAASQQQLFPKTIELNAGDAELLKNISGDLLSLGFDIREFGKNTFVINGLPGMLAVSSPEVILEKLLEEYKNSPVDAKSKAREQVAASLAKASALNYGTELNQEEIIHLIDRLFACAKPNYTPDGKKVLTIFSLDEIEKLFNR